MSSRKTSVWRISFGSWSLALTPFSWEEAGSYMCRQMKEGEREINNFWEMDPEPPRSSAVITAACAAVRAELWLYVGGVCRAQTLLLLSQTLKRLKPYWPPKSFGSEHPNLGCLKQFQYAKTDWSDYKILSIECASSWKTNDVFKASKNQQLQILLLP